jgi:molecular chaperone GrpE
MSSDDSVGFDPDLERADEVEDYTGEVQRPATGAPTPAVDGSTGFGDGDVADVDDDSVDIAALVAERDQLKDLAVRLQADFENFRKRSSTQREAEIDRATARLAEALLPVLDAAEAAFLQHPDEVGPLLTVLLGELRKHGLETLDLHGQAFDPAVAEAVSHEPGDNGEAVVAEVLRSGYLWRGKTLRPAMVKTRD